MDKQMIEDVRQDLEDINGTDGIHILGYIPLAKNLIEKGYRKIPEGAVVIEKSEYEKLRLLADECLEWRRKNCSVGELPKENAVVLTREEYEKLKDEKADNILANIDKVFKEEFEDTKRSVERKIKPIYKAIETRTRKETAEKFAERLKERAFDEYSPYGECYECVAVSDIDEIAKEITEG